MVKLLNLLFEVFSEKEKREIFKKEIEPLIPELRRVAKRYYPQNEEEQKDLVQTTLLRAYTYLDQYTPGSGAIKWLATIMKNTWYNSIKSSANKLSATNKSNKDLDNPEFASTFNFPSYTDKNLTSKYGDEIQDALSALPEVDRKILELIYVEDYQYDEVADIFNIPVGTVRSKLNRAKQLLANALLYNVLSTSKYKEKKSNTKITKMYTDNFLSQIEKALNSGGFEAAKKFVQNSLEINK